MKKEFTVKVKYLAILSCSLGVVTSLVAYAVYSQTVFLVTTLVNAFCLYASILSVETIQNFYKEYWYAKEIIRFRLFEEEIVRQLMMQEMINRLRDLTNPSKTIEQRKEEIKQNYLRKLEEYRNSQIIAN